MKTKDNKEKPEYMKYSRKELHEIFLYQFECSDELMLECYNLRLKLEQYESDMIRFMKLLSIYQDMIIKGNYGQLDIDKLVQLQGTLIKEIRTKRIRGSKPKDSNPIHESYLEFCRAGTCRNN